MPNYSTIIIDNEPGASKYPAADPLSQRVNSIPGEAGDKDAALKLMSEMMPDGVEN